MQSSSLRVEHRSPLWRQCLLKKNMLLFGSNAMQPSSVDGWLQWTNINIWKTRVSVDPRRRFQEGWHLGHGSGHKLKTKSSWDISHPLTWDCRVNVLCVPILAVLPAEQQHRWLCQKRRFLFRWHARVQQCKHCLEQVCNITIPFEFQVFLMPHTTKMLYGTIESQL